MPADFFQWVSADGSLTLTFGVDRPYILRNFEGLESTLLSPLSQKSPFQRGETALNVDVGPRMVSLNLMLVEDSWVDLNTRRAELSRALVTEIGIHQEKLKQGTLKYFRDLLPPVMLTCIPVNSPQYSTTLGVQKMVGADIDFYAAQPYWEALTETVTTLTKSGGLQFPVQFPIQFTQIKFSATINNAGDVKTPILVKINGNVVNPDIKNVTTGNIIAFFLDLETGKRLEVDTTFAAKRVEIITISSGTVINALNKIDGLRTFFWELEKGNNLVEIIVQSANENSSATLTHRNRFAGV